jgi:L-lactate utilization protein LutC
VDPTKTYEIVAPRLVARGFGVERAKDRDAARDAVLARIPKHARVMTGGSTTLEQCGISDALAKGDHDYLRVAIRAEQDAALRHKLRVEANTAPWFVSSVNAITEDGVLVAADGAGNRVAALAFGPSHVVVVASLNKVVPTLEDAMRRTREHVLPLESDRLRKAGYPGGSYIAKWTILERDAPGRTHVVLVDEPLGF